MAQKCILDFFGKPSPVKNTVIATMTMESSQSEEAVRQSMKDQSCTASQYKRWLLWMKSP